MTSRHSRLEHFVYTIDHKNIKHRNNRSTPIVQTNIRKLRDFARSFSLASVKLSFTLSHHLPRRIPRIFPTWQNDSRVVGRVANFATTRSSAAWWSPETEAQNNPSHAESSTEEARKSTPPQTPPTITPSTNQAQQSERPNATEQYARMTEVPRRIHILGTGAVGKLIAHSLRGIANPPPITLLFHRYKLLQAWRESPRTITLHTDGYSIPRTGYEVELAVSAPRTHGQSETESLYLDNPTNPQSEEPIHNLIVTVKAGHTISALSAVRHRLLPTSTICFLQNGMGVLDDVNAALFPDPDTRPNYIHGILTHGVNQPLGGDPFSATHAGHGTIALGVLPPRATVPETRRVPYRNLAQTSRYLLRTLTRTPVLAAVSMPPADLVQQQLEKLAVNAVINPLTVLLDAPNGSVLYNYAITRTMRLLLAEISLVLRSLPELKGLPNVGTRFAPERLETLVVSVANTTARNVSSMLADVRAGRRTEVRWINGYIVKRGEELGVSCVCNYMVMQLVEGKHNMIERELQDQIAVTKVDLTGES